MNCATLIPEEQQLQLRSMERERRTSRGLTSCLRGESEEYYEAEGINYIFIYYLLNIFTLNYIYM